MLKNFYCSVYALPAEQVAPSQPFSPLKGSQGIWNSKKRGTGVGSRERGEGVRGFTAIHVHLVGGLELSKLQTALLRLSVSGLRLMNALFRLLAMQIGQKLLTDDYLWPALHKLFPPALVLYLLQKHHVWEREDWWRGRLFVRVGCTISLKRGDVFS